MSEKESNSITPSDGSIMANKTSVRYVVEQMRQQGLATTSFIDFLGNNPRDNWVEICNIADKFANSDRVMLESESYRFSYSQWLKQGCPETGIPTNYILYHQGSPFTIDPQDRLFQIGRDPEINELIDQYMGCRTIMRHYDLFFNVPISSHDGRRVAAQRWHRDRRKSIKLFLYLCDVSELNGALDCVPQSRRGCKYQHIGRFGATDECLLAGDMEISDEEMNLVPVEDRLTCSLPKGNLLVFDTSMIHRGGYVVELPRIMASWAYFPETVNVESNFRH